MNLPEETEAKMLFSTSVLSKSIITSLRDLLISNDLDLGLRKAADVPKRRVCLAYWAFCPPQKGVTYNCNLSFLPHGSGHNTGGVCLSDPVNTSSVNVPSFSSSTDYPSTSRASHLLYRATWENKVARGFYLLSRV